MQVKTPQIHLYGQVSLLQLGFFFQTGRFLRGALLLPRDCIIVQGPGDEVGIIATAP